MRSGPTDSLNPQKSAIQVHELGTVGNYRIQPIDILSDSAGSEFNLWLKEHHFNSMPDELQRPYLNKGAVFLAIQADLGGAATHLKPLHIVYPAKELSFPLCFTHETRTFDMTYYVFTEKEQPRQTLASWYFNPAEVESKPVPSSAIGPLLSKYIGNRKGFITQFKARGINTGNFLLRKLKSDPTVMP